MSTNSGQKEGQKKGQKELYHVKAVAKSGIGINK